jgi:hypothetical protein
MKPFKILGRPLPGGLRTIPWDLIAPHERQAKKNHSQSLERLNERGGLSIHELYAVLNDLPWRQVSQLPEEVCSQWILNQIKPQ